MGESEGGNSFHPSTKEKTVGRGSEEVSCKFGTGSGGEGEESGCADVVTHDMSQGLLPHCGAGAAGLFVNRVQGCQMNRRAGGIEPPVSDLY